MKIIAIGDIHMATDNLPRLANLVANEDMIVISGDLTNFGGESEAFTVIDAVRQVCPRLLAVPGNLDRPEIISFLERQHIALHGRGVVVGGVGIFGCGGSNLTPFKTPLELTEDEIYETLRRGYEAVRDERPLVMVCHTPPRNTKCDRLRNGAHVGSTAARQFIEEFKPDICISGHIHESPGEDRIGPTLIFNAGPFKGGGYVLVDVNGRQLSAQLRFL